VALREQALAFRLRLCHGGHACLRWELLGLV
jgi:hypothetical protein